MEAHRHELAYDVLLAHKVVVEEHVNLEAATPGDIIAHSFYGSILVEVRRDQEASENLSRNDKFVYIIKNLRSVDCLGERVQLCFLLR